MNLDEYILEREASDPAFRAAREATRPAYAFQRALIRARLALGITQEELAARMGKSQPVIARMEAGEHPPRLDTLCQLAAALGCSLTIDPRGQLVFHPHTAGPPEPLRPRQRASQRAHRGQARATAAARTTAESKP